MNKQLFDEQTEAREVAIVDNPPENQPGALVDLRAGAMRALTPEQMQRGLGQYAELRQTFRDWLVSQLKEGTHYGYPPGCEPEMEIRNDGAWFKNRGKWHHERQWRPKKSLYKAGADFVVDLMALRDEYDADMGAWEQLGKPEGTFVRRCRLYSKTNDALLGEGAGARTVGAKGGDINNAIKMADKSAKVAAVINTYGLSDLFTQDLEDGGGQNLNENPNGIATPPAAPRGERRKVTADELKALVSEWKNTLGNIESVEPAQVQELFCKWVVTVVGKPVDKKRGFWPPRPGSWLWTDFEKCCAAAGMPNEEDFEQEPVKDEIPF